LGGGGGTNVVEESSGEERKITTNIRHELGGARLAEEDTTEKEEVRLTHFVFQSCPLLCTLLLGDFRTSAVYPTSNKYCNSKQ
jgi:hypothetical protein